MQTAALWFATALLPAGWAFNVRIVMQSGVIEQIEPGTAALPGDETHAIGLPGLPNLHSHAFQRGMAGLAEVRGAGPDSFWTWREMMYRFVDRMQPDDVEAIAAQAYVEMLEAGFTRVGEFHYLHHDPDGRAYADPAELATRIAAAAGETGIGLALLPVYYRLGGFGGQSPSHGQRRFVSRIDDYADLVDASRRAIAGLEAAVIGIAPHSLRAVAIEELRILLPLARGGPVHIHVAEQLREVEDCIAATGGRPVELLLDNAPVDENWCVIHATHLSDDEIGRLAACSAVVGLCPITEANLGDGVFPAAEFTTAGGRFGIGSDSNVAIDAAGELRLLEYGQRLRLRSRNLLGPPAGGSTGRRLFDMALAGGAQALGYATGLAVGRPADFVSLRPEHPGLLARDGDALLDSWIFGGAAGMVDCVWRHGRKQVSNGRHIRRAAVARRFHASLKRVLA